MLVAHSSWWSRIGPLARLQAFGIVAPTQLVDKMLQTRRHARRIRTKDLLETLAHGIADRSAGPVIERFGVVCIWTFHDPFRALTIVRSGDDIPSHRMRICFRKAVDSGSSWQIFDERGFPRGTIGGPNQRGQGLRTLPGCAGLIAAIDQAPAGPKRGRDQSPRIAAAVSVVVAGAADKEARAAPAMVPAAMPTAVPAPGRGGGGGERRCAQ